jgi:geranylgeranyl reductase family protein
MRIGIVGAGPAGAMAAVQLARAGASVTIFDPSHPREKPCGGGLTGRALALLDGVVDIGRLPAVTIESATVEEHDEVAQISLGGRNGTRAVSLVVLSRAVFDRALLDAAVASGAALVPEKATDVGRHGPSMVIRTGRQVHLVDSVIGADGVNSLVRKKIAAPFSRQQLSVAAGFFVRGLTSSTIAIKMMREQPGYLWSFPRPDHLAVGVCSSAAHRATSLDLRRQSHVWLQHQGLGGSAEVEPYSWPIPSAGHADAIDPACAGPGWMLIGDAAGLVDPLTREGIYYAMLSGRWAAEALAHGSLAKASLLYAERVRREIQPELVRAARLSRPFFTPTFAALLVRAIKESPAIGDVFVDLVTGVQPYQGLRRRLLATREWRLAGRVIRMLLTPAFASTMKGAVSPQET